MGQKIHFLMGSKLLKCTNVLQAHSSHRNSAQLMQGNGELWVYLGRVMKNRGNNETIFLCAGWLIKYVLLLHHACYKAFSRLTVLPLSTLIIISVS